MLAGVAGRTIEEARDNMPVEEIRIWQAYMEKNGPLALQRRLEYVAAQISMVIANKDRGKETPAVGLDQFLMWQRKEEPQEGDEVSQVLSEIRRVAAPPREDVPRKRRWKRKSDVY